MATFNGLIIASVNDFTKGNLDKNGQSPVILNVIGGKCPNRNVLSGTIAKSMGIEVGKTYLLQVREVEASETYGRQFVYSKLKELDAMEIIDASAKVGATMIFDVAEQVKETVKQTDFHTETK